MSRAVKSASAGVRKSLGGKSARTRPRRGCGPSRAERTAESRALAELQAVYQQAPVGLCFLDRDLRYVKVNEELARIKGVPVASHLGRTVRELSPELANVIEPWLKKVLETGEPVESVKLEGLNLVPGMPPVTAEINYHPVRDDNGNIIGINVAVLDITETERIEGELRESREQLDSRLRQQAAVAELGHRALVGGDDQSLLDEVAAVVAKTLGVNFSAILELLPDNQELFMRAGLGWRPEVVGKLHLDTPNATLSGFTLSGGKPVVCEDLEREQRFLVRPLLLDHGIRSCLTVIIEGPRGHPAYGILGVGSVYPRKFTQDDVGFVQSVANILTTAFERKRAERALARSEKQFREMAESLPQIVWSVRPDGQPDYFNRRWYQYTGQTMSEAMSPKSWHQVLHPQDIQPCITSWSRSLETGEPYQVEVRYRNTEGRYRWFLVRAVPVEDEQGRITRWFGSSTDIDDQKRSSETLRRARERLRHYADDLEHRVAERTSTLVESVRSLEGVLYHVAHDLRAPLRAMQGLTTLLMEEYASQFDEAGRDYAQRIVTAASRMDILIRDLLAYGRLGHVPLPMQRVELEKIVKAVLTAMKQEIEEKHAQVHLECPMPPVCANEGVLQQSISELLANAIKFVAPGVAPDVRIWAESAGSKVTLSVQDNGIGIRPEHQQRIFRVFERLHRLEDYPGTGIGLAMVAKSMERMGGRVGLESQRGVGSRFWIELSTVLPPKIRAEEDDFLEGSSDRAIPKNM